MQETEMIFEKVYIWSNHVNPWFTIETLWVCLL